MRPTTASPTEPHAHLLTSIMKARPTMSPAEFRAQLRRALLNHPTLKLGQVAQALGVTRQRVGLMVGPLGRPTCAHPDRPAPKRDKAATLLSELERRVRQGEPARAVADDLNISLTMAMRLGFRTHTARPPHGTEDRAALGCNCWRCRRAVGVAAPRGPKSGIAVRAKVLDWLAYQDPDTGEGLTQAAVAALAGTSQPIVSRIAKTENS